MSWYNPAVFSGVAAVEAGMPRIARIRVWNPDIRQKVSEARVTIELDRPAPHDCFVQWYRFKPRCWAGRSHLQPNSNRRDVWGFRQIWPLENPAVLRIQIHQGQTSALLGSVRQIFRPVDERRVSQHPNMSPYYLEHPVSYNQDLPTGVPRARTRGVKVAYKFGVVQRFKAPRPGRPTEERWKIVQGPISAETLRITRWRRTTALSGPAPKMWDFKIDVS